ncbi:MAG: BrnA antitoxin family protein, partial [Rhodospirillales bacterium]|nr:BrnA antitoxin family protein [Rhodospirillales bacterium]
PEWQGKFAEAPGRRGRPKSDVTKVRTTLRLDPDVLAAFRSGGPGWQSRINEALRKAMGLP